MAEVEQYIDVILNDKRVTAYHCSLFLALIHCWFLNNHVSPFRVTRINLMRLSHIHSLATYHKCLKELIEFSYIEYVPSYNKFVASQVSLRT